MCLHFSMIIFKGLAFALNKQVFQRCITGPQCNMIFIFTVLIGTKICSLVNPTLLDRGPF